MRINFLNRCPTRLRRRSYFSPQPVGRSKRNTAKINASIWRAMLTE